MIPAAWWTEFAVGSRNPQVGEVEKAMAMSKRTCLSLIVLLLLLIAGVGVGGYLLTPPTPKPGVTLENFKRLHAGMTEEEVEKIFGSKGTDRGANCNFKYRLLFWDDGEATVWISFVNETCSGCYYVNHEPITSVGPKPVGILEMFSSWIAARLGL
jgi:hypothetical protein